MSQVLRETKTVQEVGKKKKRVILHIQRTLAVAMDPVPILRRQRWAAIFSF